MSLVIAAVRQQQAFVVSDGSVMELDGSEFRRCSSCTPKFRDVGNGIMLAATGIDWVLDRAYANVSTLIHGDRAATIDDVARFLAANLPAWDRECEARFPRSHHVGRKPGSNATVAILGYDASQSRARCVGFQHEDGFKPNELQFVAFGVQTGLDIRPIQLALGSGAPRRTILRLMQKAVARVARQDDRVGGEIFSAVVDPTYVSPPAVRPQTDTAAASECRRAINGGSSWTSVGVSAGLMTTFAITRTTSKQTVLIQALNAIDSQYGHQTTVEVDAYDAGDTSLGTVTIDTNGVWGFTVVFPPPVQSFKWLASTGSPPTDATVASSGTVVTASGTAVTVNSGGTLSFGQTIYITILPYLGASGTGSTLKSFALRGAYTTFTATKTANYGPGGWVETDDPVTLSSYGISRDTANGNMFTGQVPGGGGQIQRIAMFPLLPSGTAGVTVTNFSVDVWNDPLSITSGFNVAVFRKTSGGGSSGLASGSSTIAGGWQTLSFNVSESTQSRGYLIRVHVPGPHAGADGALGNVTITYTMSDPKQAF